MGWVGGWGVWWVCVVWCVWWGWGGGGGSRAPAFPAQVDARCAQRTARPCGASCGRSAKHHSSWLTPFESPNHACRCSIWMVDDRWPMVIDYRRSLIDRSIDDDRIIDNRWHAAIVVCRWSMVDHRERLVIHHRRMMIADRSMGGDDQSLVFDVE